MDKQTIKEKVMQPILNAGFDVYFVGGCVRDSLLNRKVSDFDLVTNATPENIHTIFSTFSNIDSEKFGVTMPIIDNEIIEIASFRKDLKSSNGRHPDSISFIGDMKEDAMRRDFTMNALYEDINGSIFDPTNKGLSDVHNNILRFIGNPSKKIKEDSLRALRACRFISELDFTPNEYFSINRKDFNSVSFERIGSELKKLFNGKNPVKGITFGVMTGVFNTHKINLSKAIFDMKNEEQRPDYHFGNVLQHTFSTMENLKSIEYDYIDMMAAFFHDIGKPIAGKRNGKYRKEDDFNSHVDHEKDSEKFFLNWVKERPGMFSNSEIDTINNIVKNHTRVGRIGEIKEPFKIFEIVSNTHFLRTVKLEIADQNAHRKVPNNLSNALTSSKVQSIIKRVNESRKITGNDLINAGLKPNPLFKKRLHVAFKTQINHPEFSKEDLLRTALSVNK